MCKVNEITFRKYVKISLLIQRYRLQSYKNEYYRPVHRSVQSYGTIFVSQWIHSQQQSFSSVKIIYMDQNEYICKCHLSDKEKENENWNLKWMLFT